MDFLWSPWRYRYVASASEKSPSCVFCVADDKTRDAERLVVFRLDRLDDSSPEQLAEMMTLAQRGLAALRKLYNPEGFNIGMNLGHAAGAGIREHIHLHVVPRWTGDANFMTITAETRVLPEELPITYRRIVEAF
jgi:ATP adenylyltransferase